MKVRRLVKQIVASIRLFNEYMNDYYRFIRYSGLFYKSKSNENKILLSRIISQTHSIEKGLTMPDVRLGFGKDKLTKLIKDCSLFIAKSDRDIMVDHAISVLLEYEKLHADNNFKLDYEISNGIRALVETNCNIESSSQISTSRLEYFSDINEDFGKFSESRKSIRNFDEKDIDIEKIKVAVELAMNSPSSCNRQGTRIYVFTNKDLINKILSIQGGNRGFGHLTNKLILITSDQGISTGYVERNIGYVDGGMFAMNLLYSLHYNQIGACSLNCNFSVKKDKLMREITGVKNSEVFVLLISCGNVPNEYKIAISKRKKVESILSIR